VPGCSRAAANQQGQQAFPIRERHRVFELLARGAEFARLDVQERGITGKPDAHRAVRIAIGDRAGVVEVALRDARVLVRRGPPGVGGDEEFSFYFDGHGFPRNVAEADLASTSIEIRRSREGGNPATFSYRGRTTKDTGFPPSRE